ncbi:molybdopterin binding protein [Nitrobacter sp. Nb-311A]|uniref:NTP transferase domain-containing protein n=1 Tax=unclassified Nitrobacter TaxID=2620411 RepID=UPI00006873CC|nr:MULTISPECIES: molybdopterin-binding/glycosyltransferase family 2 protein [unclassified Nitrobacter]EAQ35417.1 molybdopterin binding protein [Nitrobacter sp. Nb-311A]MCB1391914.1 molybdopterin-binding/glycosyltransferase family 2 protein [Nitrobacter sp.]MCV0385087.1 molybdopterin-binding/glycosyltransferase family 2 protein [Nitrobacter sp.]
MKFGPATPDDAIGGVTVHTLRQGTFVLKKGTLIGPVEVEALHRAGVKEVVVVRLEDGDVSEDVAAADVAKAVAGDGVTVERAFTGRANLFAARAGVLVIDRPAVNRINNIDEAITFATLPAYKPVVQGEMIATVKLIPFGVEAKLRDAAVAAARGAVLQVAPYRIKRVGVVSTMLPGLAPKVVDKTLRVTAERLAPAGASIIAERRVPHDESVLSDAIKEMLDSGAELVIVFGASAIADRRDVIPAALVGAGGVVQHFGMPVDPGNLLLIGKARGVPVLGAPGCARSPVENGFDWVLMRLLAGLNVARRDLTGMGVGGLLMEIVTRPQPRISPASDNNCNIAAVILAAGRSTRMGGPNKLLAELAGKPLVRIVTEQVLASKAASVTVVTGHQAAEVERALRGLNVTFVYNPDFPTGLASSIKVGIGAIPKEAGGALICLGDMPLIDAHLVDRLIAAFAPDRGMLIAVPVSGGRQGNPVLWSRRFFGELMALEGDVGARHLLAGHAEVVAEVSVDAHGAFFDVDTPQALAEVQRG